MSSIESPPKPKLTRGQRVRHWGVRFGWFWLLYTLSIGPMFWSWYESVYISGPMWVSVVYLPLLVACELCPPFGWLVNSYINLWIV